MGVMSMACCSVGDACVVFIAACSHCLLCCCSGSCLAGKAFFISLSIPVLRPVDGRGP